jgi:hypothetical protein
MKVTQRIRGIVADLDVDPKRPIYISAGDVTFKVMMSDGTKACAPELMVRACNSGALFIAPYTSNEVRLIPELSSEGDVLFGPTLGDE